MAVIKNKSSDDSLRERLKSTPSSSASLSSIWAEQKQIAREEALEQQRYRQAKKEARALRKSIVKNQLGTRFEQVISRYDSAIDVTRAFLGRAYAQKVVRKGVVAVIVLIAGFVSFSAINKDNSSTQTLGETTLTESVADLPRETPVFSLLVPAGSDLEDFDIVRISPAESSPSYTYLDSFTDNGPIFRVTQQEVPKDFNLANTATDFQATSIIQIDDNVVYHGYSEKGGIQSLIFIKDNKLISIRSPQKFSDDTWAGYIISLN